ncbi:hypothetical protein BTN49_2858 [Candidatus Enterovibrio escicola]|uniref:Uncharacterized protein n=1 Tax=Candidatus Enterovibrio escicola TaxID=1927127 RepID=A0A2A5T0A3_9GAMM|nr:hypothetical protein BTN49_2858 [Candidatus Enterovibrio escacola]
MVEVATNKVDVIGFEVLISRVMESYHYRYHFTTLMER